MKVPNGETAVVDPRKLAGYCLSPSHPVGRHKAAVFRGALGIGAEHADWLREILLRAAVESDAVLGAADEFGQRYRIDVTVTTDTGSATVLSAWIILAGETIPRLSTCYVLSEGPR